MIGLLFILLGGWFVASPQSALNAKIWWAKQLGAKLTGSKKTLTAFRYVGIVFVAVGLLMLFR